MHNHVTVTCNSYVTVYNIILTSKSKSKNKKINENESKLSLLSLTLTRVGGLRVLDIRIFQGP